VTAPVPAGSSAAAPPPTVGDLAISAAEGTRTTARWLASALGAVPSLALLAALVRAPGDAGYDTTLLVAGVVSAAAGALVGVLGFAAVLVPLALEAPDLSTFDLSRVPAQPYRTVGELTAALTRLRDGATDTEGRLTAAYTGAQHAEQKKLAAESAVVDAELASEAKPRDKSLAQALRAARGVAAKERTTAGSATADLMSLQFSHGVWRDQVRRAELIQRDAFLLQAADEVRQRFRTARVLAVISVLLVAAGVLMLASAPQPKPKESTPSPASSASTGPVPRVSGSR
jgi:hypothetical protein